MKIIPNWQLILETTSWEGRDGKFGKVYGEETKESERNEVQPEKPQVGATNLGR